jgi:branched-chain amino acid aminotransferase
MGNVSYLDNIAWHNGNWCQVRDLQVSILDLGLIHSDATYDVMAFINNRGIKLEQHINRFLTSCSYWRIPISYTAQELIDIVIETHARTNWDNSIIWLSITRGVPLSGNPRDLTNCTPNVMCYAKPYQLFNGTNTATVYLSDQLRVPDVALNQNHKNFVWQDLTRAQWQAIDLGYDTAILLSTDGYLTEGPGFNVAIVKNNTVIAPASNRLPGVSMQLIKDLCDENAISFKFANIDLPMLTSCDDMFLTTTVGNLATVTRFNERTLTLGAIQEKLILLLKGIS